MFFLQQQTAVPPPANQPKNVHLSRYPQISNVPASYSVTFIILKRPLLFFRRKTSRLGAWESGVAAVVFAPGHKTCLLRSGSTKGCTSYRLMKSSPAVSLLCFFIQYRLFFYVPRLLGARKTDAG